MERYLLPALLILNFIVGSNASLQNEVHRGLQLQTALKQARTICPENLDSSKILKLKEKISYLLSPSFVVSDPNRRTYKASYIESPEEINRHLREICGSDFSLDPATFEQPNTEMGPEETGNEEIASTEEIASAIYQKEKESTNSYNLNGYVLFFFGFVSGMLPIFAYFTQKNQPSVQDFKSLRRPEL